MLLANSSIEQKNSIQLTSTFHSLVNRLTNQMEKVSEICERIKLTNPASSPSYDFADLGDAMISLSETKDQIRLITVSENQYRAYTNITRTQLYLKRKQGLIEFVKIDGDFRFITTL